MQQHVLHCFSCTFGHGYTTADDSVLPYTFSTQHEHDLNDFLFHCLLTITHDRAALAKRYLEQFCDLFSHLPFSILSSLTEQLPRFPGLSMLLYSISLVSLAA